MISVVAVACASPSALEALAPSERLGPRTGVPCAASTPSIPIAQKRGKHTHTLEVEHLHELSKANSAPCSPVFTPVSPVAIAVKFLQESDDEQSSSDSDTPDSDTMALPATPLRPTLIYLAEDGQIQYTLGDAPPARLRDLKWYAYQLAARDQMVADMRAEKLPDEAIQAIASMKIADADASRSSPYPPPGPSATRVPPRGDAVHADAEVHIVDYGVAEIRLSTPVPISRQPWHVPVTVYIEADGVTIDMHADTPEGARARIIVSALRHAYNQLAPVMQHVESAIRAAMPGYMGLSGIRPSPPPVAPSMVRTHHLSTPVSSPMPSVGIPGLILVNTLTNMYLLMYPAGASPTSPDWVRFGGTLDLTSETLTQGTIYQHPLAPPIVKVSHDLFLRALRRVVGISASPPSAVVRAMMRADAVGECQRHEEEDSDDYDGDDYEDSDEELDFEIDPEMFGG